MTTLQTQIPDQLLQQAQYLVQQGWVANIDGLIVEAMRRYLESHQEAMTKQFIREDMDGVCAARVNCSGILLLAMQPF